VFELGGFAIATADSEGAGVTRVKHDEWKSMTSLEEIGIEAITIRKIDGAKLELLPALQDGGLKMHVEFEEKTLFEAELPGIRISIRRGSNRWCGRLRCSHFDDELFDLL